MIRLEVLANIWTIIMAVRNFIESYSITNWCNDRVTHSWCEVTAVTRRIVDSREMTRSSEDVHFIVVSIQHNH